MRFINRQRRLPLLAAAVVVAIGLPAVYGEDSYETVTIGGKRWMRKNLNLKTEDSWCYRDSDLYCNAYGRLYTWGAAKSACSLAGSGWRLPTRTDWDSLKASVGGSKVAGKKLKAKISWDYNGNGTDDYNFSALPVGYRRFDGRFDNIGIVGQWWTATEYDTDKSYYQAMYSVFDDVCEYAYSKEHIAFSVRCVRD
jgi:uncharacterized protein (TIGR02145 family)